MLTLSLVSAVGFQLKGSGWYATDFKNGSKSKSEGKAGSKEQSYFCYERNRVLKPRPILCQRPAMAKYRLVLLNKHLARIFFNMKRYFITGLLIWVPLGMTAWVLKFLIGTMDQSLLLLPDNLQPERLLGMNIPGIGTVLTLLVVFITGLLTANIIGQKLGVILGRSIVAYPSS